MREFELLQPKTLPAALDAFASGSASVQPLAGGTDMIVNLRARTIAPDVLVALADLSELKHITTADSSIVIGAGTTIARLMTDSIVSSYSSLITSAGHVFANPMIRNLATIGGNLSSASPAGDLLPPLLALDARVELANKSGSRMMPIEEFFLGPRKTARRADELVLAIHLPKQEGEMREAFFKLGLRQADAISVVSVAVRLVCEGATVRQARVALGAVAPTPMRARRAEAVLQGEKFSTQAAALAARLAAEECSPISDVRGSAEYRRRMVKVLVARVLEQAWNQNSSN